MTKTDYRAPILRLIEPKVAGWIPPGPFGGVDVRILTIARAWRLAGLGSKMR